MYKIKCNHILRKTKFVICRSDINWMWSPDLADSMIVTTAILSIMISSTCGYPCVCYNCKICKCIHQHFIEWWETCRQLSKKLPDNSTIFAAEATAISLALNYYQHMGPIHHDVVVYSDSMSCLQAIEVEDTENPFICHIMNLLWSLGDKGTRVRFCWVPSHCGIEGNERVDQLAKETLDQYIEPLASVHYTDMKPLVNSYIQKLVQTMWDVAVHGRDLYLVKPTLGPSKKFQPETRIIKSLRHMVWMR